MTPPGSLAMKVTVNGDEKEVPEGLDVTALLAYLGLPLERVAVERNYSILPRERWAVTRVEPDDRYEVVHLVGGG
jgi:thiamine biosynthesis protein ThiS